MAFAVRRPGGRWEIRESAVTEAGPRARTLASFRVLTPDIARRAADRASVEMAPDEVAQIAARAGAPLAITRAEQLARELSELLGGGALLPVRLERRLVHDFAEAGRRRDPGPAVGPPVISGADRYAPSSRGPSIEADEATDDSTVKGRIVMSAIDCLRSSGVRNTKMSTIAEHAGIARPNLYRYFPSRQALILRAVVTETRLTHPARRARLPVTGRGADLLVDALMLGYETAIGDVFLQSLIADAKIIVDLMASDSDVLPAELEYWAPIFAYCRGRGELRQDLDDETIMRWLLFFQFTCLERREFFTAEVYRSHLRTFVIPALLATPSQGVDRPYDDTLYKKVSASSFGAVTSSVARFSGVRHAPGSAE